MGNRTSNSPAGRRWRDYSTPSGRRQVRDFLRGLPDRDLAAVLAAMAEVRQEGTRSARHLKGDLWEVRATSEGVAYRLIFAEEGKRGRVLLSLVAFKKKTQKTPPQTIRLAQRRLDDWRSRGQ